MKQPLALFMALLMLVSSCSINSHVMLKTPKDFVFDEIPTNTELEYVITQDDLLQFRLYSNGGFVIIDITSGNQGSPNLIRSNSGTGMSYLVKPNGFVKLPILGEVNLIGKTIKKAEEELEKMYAEYYVEPFMQLEVINKRVIVFPGSGSNARVVTLQNNSTTLLEVIAQVGGISNNSKANTIKVMREKPDKRDIYLIDLSTIEGLQNGDMIVQANDIIYVEPNANIAREILQEVAPIVSLITSAVLVWAAVRNLSP